MPISTPSATTLRAAELLRQLIGLDATTIGFSTIERAVRLRMAAAGAANGPAYLDRLSRDPAERDLLVDEVVVPESWFFRDPQVFDVLRRLALARSAMADRPPLRILCAPCAAGEEPYSAAIALLDAGLPPDRFSIHAADVSRICIARALAARYTANAFRNPDQDIRPRWFAHDGSCHLLVEPVRRQVHFFLGNLLDDSFAAGSPAYDVVFCRNLLIYLTPEARRRVERACDRLLAPDGLLVVGAAEPGTLAGPWTPADGGAACALVREAGHRVRPAAPVPAPAVATDQVTAHTSGEAASHASSHAFGCGPGHAPGVDGLDAALREATALADAGRYAEALELCASTDRRTGPEASLFFLMGRLHQATGDLDRAESCFQKTLYLDGDRDDAILALASVARQRGDGRMADRYRQSAARVLARKATP
jgi:chemotaxis protein methyltransferase WspC